MLSMTPISPEQRLFTNDERMQEHTHLARLCGGVPIPLALFTQQTGAAAADAGSVHDAQATISFLASFMGEQVVASRTPERAIGLKRKVVSGEASRFPGRRCGRWNVPRDRSGGGWRRGSSLARLWENWSKLGSAYQGGLKQMPRF